MQSAFDHTSAPGLHVAIIMDGNGRWATARGLPRPAGHRAGIEAVRRTVEAAPALGIHLLTLYAFSSDNWKRPAAEVRALMHLLRTQLPAEAARCRTQGVRLSVMGRRDRLPAAVRRAVEQAEACTASGTTLHVRLALDYSARDAILRATRHTPGGEDACHTTFTRALALACHTDAAPDVDLLIRTGGEQRLSDFLLWECAYAELYFTPCLWPDFDASALQEAVASFSLRDRRFGGISSPYDINDHPLT